MEKNVRELVHYPILAGVVLYALSLAAERFPTLLDPTVFVYMTVVLLVADKVSHKLLKI